MSRANGPQAVADVLAASLHGAGVRWAFGHPGGEVVVLLDALRRAGIRFTLAHHETEGALIAGGIGELTGIPALAISTLGPGATNMVTGVASAYLERTPLVAISANLATSMSVGTTHQELPLVSMFAQVSKASVAVDTANAAVAGSRAVALSRMERPGSVCLHLPPDIAESAALAPGPAAAGSPAADAGAIGSPADAARMLAAARRPVMLVGLGATRWGLEGKVRQLAEALRCPVLATPKAKGIVNEDHPLFLGVVGVAGSTLLDDLIEQADLILAVGCDVVEFYREWIWSPPVLHLDRLPNLEGFYKAAAELTGEPADSLAMLTDSARAGSWPGDTVARKRAELLDYICPPSPRLQPWQVVEDVQAAMGQDAIVACDVGAHKHLMGQAWRTTKPKSFFMANGLSSMGYGIPTGIAAGLVARGRPAAALVGDGGLSMYFGVLETAVRLGVSLQVVVFADRALELIRRNEQRRNMTTDGVTFENPDFRQLGSAFGIPAFEVSTRGELQSALQQCRHQPGVRLIAANIDGADYRLR